MSQLKIVALSFLIEGGIYTLEIRQQLQQIESQTLSPFATHSIQSKGREIPLEECPIRTPFQRDRDRIIHCNSFRRMMHKTQVFLNPQGDHYRTRLTHTLEVGQIARTMTRALRLHEDLAEAIAMGHDLGHTPFGHSGEFALRDCSPIFFVHSEQSVRIVTKLEQDGAGLNLTKEVINGILCHSDKYPWANTPEGRIVRLADKFAYLNHDTQDAFRAGIISEDNIPYEVRINIGNSVGERLSSMITSVVENSHDGNITMDEETNKAYQLLKAYLFKSVYTNSLAKQEENKAKEIVCRLYEYYNNNPKALPPSYYKTVEAEGIPRGVVDYISGMSDRYCVTIYKDLFLPKQWGY